MASYTINDQEVIAIKDFVDAMFGAPVVSVELADNHYVHAFNASIEEYSQYINQWAVKSHIANALGLPSTQDFTLRWVSQNFEFAKAFSKAYSEQVHIGGTVPVRKDYITLIEGKQNYYLPNDREIIDVMWQEPPAINRHAANPNLNPSWVNQEFGWGYQSGDSYTSMLYVAPVSFTIQLANATEVRYRTLRGDYSYSVTPAAADATRTSPDYSGQTENNVSIFPVPKKTHNDMKVWYFYKLKADLNSYSTQETNDLVSNPGTLKIDEIPYDEFNSISQRWIKQYTLATCKEILGRIRSKFSELPIPDATVTMDGEALIDEAQNKQEQLKEQLLLDLEAMDVGKLIADDADNAENINRTLGMVPGGIFVL